MHSPEHSFAVQHSWPSSSAQSPSPAQVIPKGSMGSPVELELLGAPVLESELVVALDASAPVADTVAVSGPVVVSSRVVEVEALSRVGSPVGAAVLDAEVDEDEEAVVDADPAVGLVVSLPAVDPPAASLTLSPCPAVPSSAPTKLVHPEAKQFSTAPKIRRGRSCEAMSKSLGGRARLEQCATRRCSPRDSWGVHGSRGDASRFAAGDARLHPPVRDSILRTQGTSTSSTDTCSPRSRIADAR